MQKNWIGKSIGCDLIFKVNGQAKDLKVFTTRPDTIFGASFIAISVDHELCKFLEKDKISINLKMNAQKLEQLKKL